MVVAFRRFIERLARFPPAAPCFYSSDRQSANHGAAVLVWILIFPLRCFFNSSALLSFVLGFQRKKNVFALTHMFYRQPPSTSSVIRPFFFCFSFYFFSLPSSPPSFSSLWFFERSWWPAVTLWSYFTFLNSPSFVIQVPSVPTSNWTFLSFVFKRFLVFGSCFIETCSRVYLGTGKTVEYLRPY